MPRDIPALVRSKFTDATVRSINRSQFHSDGRTQCHDHIFCRRRSDVGYGSNDGMLGRIEAIKHPLNPSIGSPYLERESRWTENIDCTTHPNGLRQVFCRCLDRILERAANGTCQLDIPTHLGYTSEGKIAYGTRLTRLVAW